MVDTILHSAKKSKLFRVIVQLIMFTRTHKSSAKVTGAVSPTKKKYMNIFHFGYIPTLG